MNDAMSIGTAVPWEVLGVSWQSLEGSGSLNAGLLSEVLAWQVAAAQCHFYPELLVLELGLDVSVFSVLLRTVQSPCKPDPTPRPPLHVHLPCRIRPHCVKGRGPHQLLFLGDSNSSHLPGGPGSRSLGRE